MMTITIEGIVLGLFALGIGLAFAFWGFRLFLILLPIWGFFAGLLFGAGAVTYLFGDGFLSTVTSWVVGVLVGVLFALLSYLYYWFAVIFLGASLGYAAGIGLMHWLGNGGGILAFTVGVVFAIAVALLFIFLRVPKYLILIATSFGGASAAISGLAVLLGFVPLAALQGGTIGSYVADELSWVWLAAALVLGAVGFYYQWRATDRIEHAMYDDYRNPGMRSSPVG
jgi:hypothetical protein